MTLYPIHSAWIFWVRGVWISQLQWVRCGPSKRVGCTAATPPRSRPSPTSPSATRWQSRSGTLTQLSSLPCHSFFKPYAPNFDHCSFMNTMMVYIMFCWLWFGCSSVCPSLGKWKLSRDGMANGQNNRTPESKSTKSSFNPPWSPLDISKMFMLTCQ